MCYFLFQGQAKLPSIADDLGGLEDDLDTPSGSSEVTSDVQQKVPDSTQSGGIVVTVGSASDLSDLDNAAGQGVQGEGQSEETEGDDDDMNTGRELPLIVNIILNSLHQLETKQ